MVETQSALRERALVLLAKNGEKIALAGLVVAVVLFCTALFFQGAPQRRVSDTETVASVDLQSDTTTITTENSTLWENGTILENRDVYSLHTTSALEYRITGQTSSPESQTRVEQRIIVNNTREAGAVLYSQRSVVASSRGESVDMTFEINIQELRKLRDSLRNEYGSDVNLEVTLTVQSTVPVKGQSYTIEKTDQLALYRKTYTPPDLDIQENKVEKTVRTRMDRSRVYTPGGFVVSKSELHLSVGGIILVFASGGVFVAGRNIDTQKAKTALTHARYHAYITEVEGPIHCEDSAERTRSLLQLINFAINTENQVMCASGVYYVKGENQIIAHDPSGEYEALSEFEFPPDDQD